MAWSKTHALGGAAAVLVAALGATPLSAQEQQPERSGNDTVTRDNKVFELGEGHVAVLISEKGITMADDPDNPIHMSLVDCVGWFEEFPDKSYKGTGYCTNTDRGGDKLFNRWSASSDMPQNRYEVVGGTGKFAGATGGGTVEVTDLSPGPQGRAVARWTGRESYPNARK